MAAELFIGFLVEQGVAVDAGCQRLLPCFPTPDAAGDDVLMCDSGA